MKGRIISLVLGLIAISTSPSAHACLCPIIEPDVAYQNAVIVFSGAVEKITDHKRTIEQKREIENTVQLGLPTIIDGRTVRLKVEEYFKGSGAAEIDLRISNTSCDIFFEEGKRYIVYANREGNTRELVAHACSRTRLIDDYAKPDISYLRRVSSGEQPTMLYGFVFKNSPESAKLGRPESPGDLSVFIEGYGKRIELKTDAGGYFETFDLPAGSYRVTTSLTGKLRGAEAKTIDLKTVASIMFRTTMLGSLSGRLIDKEGRPVRDLQLELVGAATPLERKTYTASRDDGTFVFDEVFAGKYLIAVNSDGRRSLSRAPFLPSYFPNASSTGEAQMVTVENGQSVEVGDFVLQDRYSTVPVSGIVMTDDGEPVAGAYVNLYQSGGQSDSARSLQTGADGRFVHQAFEGLTYILNAYSDAPSGGRMHSENVEVTAAKSDKEVRLVVRAPGT